MFQAIIFDFNGVISNDEPFHFAALQRVLKEQGVEISEEDYRRSFLGKDDRDCFREALQSHNPFLSAEALAALIQRKSDYYIDLVKEGVQIFPGVAAFLEQAHLQCALAIASGALRREIEFVLDRSTLRAYFSCIVSSEDVFLGKPDPEIFLKALTEINWRRSPSAQVLPENCLVIEDSKAGVKAALSAGMRCFAVTNSFPASELAGAHRVIPSLDCSVASLQEDWS